MFGSDFANLQALGIDIIREADFLTPEQKAHILCNNAARFFRLPARTCEP
jgi:predicted TIM-barrel fold metal-dependent hydrolase